MTIASRNLVAGGRLLAAVLLSGCSGRAAFLKTPGGSATRTVYVNSSNNNQAVDLNVGDELVVYLPAINGGKWQLLQSVTPQLINRYPVSTAGDGTTFYFIANAAGLEHASFQTRPGTQYTSAGSSYDLRVNVANRTAPTQ